MKYISFRCSEGCCYVTWTASVGHCSILYQRKEASWHQYVNCDQSWPRLCSVEAFVTSPAPLTEDKWGHVNCNQIFWSLNWTNGTWIQWIASRVSASDMKEVNKNRTSRWNHHQSWNTQIHTEHNLKEQYTTKWKYSIFACNNEKLCEISSSISFLVLCRKTVLSHSPKQQK